MANSLQTQLNDIAQNFVSQISEAVRNGIIESLGNGEPVLVRRGPGRPRKEENGVAEVEAPAKVRKPISRERMKALKLNGQYMGGLKSLNAAQIKQVKKLRAEKGVEAALKIIAKMAKANA